MPPSLLTVLYAVPTVLFFLSIRSRIAKKRRNPKSLPQLPGPKGLPIVGNVLDFPHKHPWETYAKWTKEYGGPGVHLEALGQPVIILGTHEAAMEIMEKRQANYANRPYLTGFDLMRLQWAIPNIQPGADLRAHRRAMHEFLNANVVGQYRSILEQETEIFRHNLKKDPEEFHKHIRRFFGSIVLRVSYGNEDPEYNDQLTEKAEELMAGIIEIGVLGKFLVNFFPFMRYIPAWFPGAGWKRKLLHWASLSDELFHVPFDDVLKTLRNGGRIDCMESMAAGLAERILSSEENPSEAASAADQERVAKAVTAIGYIVGVDTSVSMGYALFLALAKYPEAQRKAQEELASVIGNDRLPIISDKPNLPYIAALTAELFRWFSVGPLGLIHVAAKDDEYEGYFIPKGAYVMANSWAMMNDPEVFPDPFNFKPERFLNKDGAFNTDILQPDTVSFGFGRRVCPGRFLASDAMFLMITHLLFFFDLGHAKDEKGREIPIELEYTSALVTSPLPFKCSITPRTSIPPVQAALL